MAASDFIETASEFDTYYCTECSCNFGTDFSWMHLHISRSGHIAANQDGCTFQTFIDPIGIEKEI